jgi:hypothetical protein
MNSCADEEAEDNEREWISKLRPKEEVGTNNWDDGPQPTKPQPDLESFLRW